jgi:hypothetical protein
MFPETFSQSDWEMFYLFVQRLLTVSKKDRPRYWLEENLKADGSHKLSSEDIEKYCDVYEHLKGFKNVRKSYMAKLIAKDKFEKSLEEARKMWS